MSGEVLRPNGPGAAAIVSAAFGCFVLGVAALAGDASAAVAKAFNVWNPTGPLSGVTGLAILVWLASWLVLAQRWKARDLNLAVVNTIAVVLFAGGVLLTFPPFMDLLQGK